jgi:effector-binding domain-containing protein
VPELASRARRRTLADLLRRLNASAAVMCIYFRERSAKAQLRVCITTAVDYGDREETQPNVSSLPRFLGVSQSKAWVLPRVHILVKETEVEYEVALRDLPADRVVTLREKVPRNTIGDVVPRLIDEVEAALAVTYHGPAFLACPVPDGTADDELVEIEAGFLMTGIPRDDIVAAEPCEVREVSERRAISTVHVGPYEEIGAAYDALNAWMAENGEKADARCDEIFFTRPDRVPPAEYRTELVWALQ